MDVQELIGALFNIALVVMIVATMVSAGFTMMPDILSMSSRDNPTLNWIPESA